MLIFCHASLFWIGFEIKYSIIFVITFMFLLLETADLSIWGGIKLEIYILHKQEPFADIAGTIAISMVFSIFSKYSR